MRIVVVVRYFASKLGIYKHGYSSDKKIYRSNILVDMKFIYCFLKMHVYVEKNRIPFKYFNTIVYLALKNVK